MHLGIMSSKQKNLRIYTVKLETCFCLYCNRKMMHNTEASSVKLSKLPFE